MDVLGNWCDMLDRILECPVCLDLPTSKILQCESGHHICSFCCKKLQLCPLCHENFIQTRNLCVENLLESLKDIKMSIQNGIKRELQKNQLLVPKTISTQTDSTITKKCSSMQTEPMATDKEIINPFVLYQCLIGICTLRLSYIGLIKHLREFHRDIFQEIEDAIAYSRKFIIDAIGLPKNYDFAFRICNMGLFFFNITIHDNRELIAKVQLVNNNISAEAFKCEVLLQNKDHLLRKHGMVTSCEHGGKLVFRIQRKEMLPLLLNNASFECILQILKQL